MPSTMTEEGVTSIAVPPLTMLLHSVAQHAVVLIPAAGGCSLSLLTTDGRRITSVATDRTGYALTALCDRASENPCSSAWRNRDVVLADISAGPAGWPWAAHARDLGIRTVLAAALISGERRIGTVSVMSSEPAAFGTTDVEMFTDFARDAAHRIDACQSPRHVTPSRVAV
ncbi:GAF domain-containing protein [Mycolicibacterium sp. BiH015]|uniref:GAF domain-containing protein n=1 Tax=Mycolicibacterium sp. BiH015 TaxID=3018808 RepID=UPI0022E1FA16|nr:GAF domain-containing protein [Mycolicibacterium sp. BiH015]MDA2890585.1 GAF domain-containing protein [Mycolicibacterium sp. BiH015]